MVSKFGWVDFAEEDRQKMLDVVDLFNMQDTRDELGVGTIRDAFADHFFPGTSTIQTRARYFLFIPWIYIEVEKKHARTKMSADQLFKEVDRCEKRLIRSLIAGGEEEGVIGIEAKEKLQRMPSNIYWTGLNALKIRLFKGSQAQYNRYLSYAYDYAQTAHLGFRPGSKEHDEPALEKQEKLWHQGIPPSPIDLFKNATLKLTADEANYLRARIVESHPQSLFAFFLLEEQKALNTDFFWRHPLIESTSASLKDQISHARLFSETTHGAMLLYNLMLSEAKESPERIDDYRDKIEKWASALSPFWAEVKTWCRDTDSFWKSTALSSEKIPPRTKTFVDQWCGILAEASKPGEIADSVKARTIIRFREHQLKKNRARLHNSDALMRWSGASGTAQLNFRWRISKSHLSDIYNGLYDRDESNA